MTKKLIDIYNYGTSHAPVKISETDLVVQIKRRNGAHGRAHLSFGMTPTF